MLQVAARLGEAPGVLREAQHRALTLPFLGPTVPRPGWAGGTYFPVARSYAESDSYETPMPGIQMRAGTALMPSAATGQPQVHV